MVMRAWSPSPCTSKTLAPSPDRVEVNPSGVTGSPSGSLQAATGVSPVATNLAEAAS